MEKLGKVERKEVYYLPIRNHPNWKSVLPKANWLAFTIADKNDKDLIPVVTEACLKKNVVYTCSTGELASITEDYFDEETSWKTLDHSSATNDLFTITTYHEDMAEGLWFSIAVARHPDCEIEKVVCIDLTKKKKRKQLDTLIKRFKEGSYPE